MKIGKTHMGRDISALKVTQNAKTRTDNTRPAVLYNAQQHARSGSPARRAGARSCTSPQNYDTTPDNAVEEEVTQLVNTRELWFICISNLDGYEYTFTHGNRLWRKNMADNNGNGVRGEVVDGVDPNRNHATHWGLDNEGSSTTRSSRRPTAAPARPPSPRPRPCKALWDHVDFAFQKNDHTAAELLLWPNGFQQYTPTPDDKLFEAYAGDDAKPAIADKVFNEETEEWEITGNRFDPDIGAELYITNGDLTDDAYENGILAFTPEGSESDLPNVSGFEFQDDEADIEEEFQRHRLFSLDLAKSAEDPANPISHMGNTVQELLRRDVHATPTATRRPSRSSQEVAGRRQAALPDQRRRGQDGQHRRVHGRRALRRGAGPSTTACAAPSPGPSRATRSRSGSTGGRHASRFTYTARSETGNKVLILSAENYTGGHPATTDPPAPLPDVLHRRAGRQRRRLRHLRRRPARQPLAGLPRRAQPLRRRDLVHGRRLPDPPARAAAGTGTARLAVEEMIDVRHFLNEGGKLFYTGKNAGRQYAEGNEFRNFGFPEPPESRRRVLQQAATRRRRRSSTRTSSRTADGCIPHNDDFLQYYLGRTSTPRPATRSTTRTAARTAAARTAGRSRACRGSSTRRAPTTRTTRRRS